MGIIRRRLAIGYSFLPFRPKPFLCLTPNTLNNRSFYQSYSFYNSYFEHRSCLKLSFFQSCVLFLDTTHRTNQVQQKVFCVCKTVSVND